MLAGDPGQLDEATRYLEGTVRPHVEAQHGNRGLTCLVIELWNAKDREGWMAGHDLHRLDAWAPGGLRLTGREAAETVWSMYNDAFPDNRRGRARLAVDIAD